MFFSNKPQLLVYLRRDSFDIFGKSTAKFVFPEGLIQNLEVENGNLLHDQVASFLNSQQINKANTIFLLDDGVIFQKVMPANTNTNVKALQDDYASKTPFEPADVAVISLMMRDQVVLIASSKGLYAPIVKAFTDYGCKVMAVAPAAIFGRGQVNQEYAESVLKNNKNAEKANFLRT